MGRALSVVITIVLLLLQSSVVFAAEGQVLKVVNGDTFNVAVDGARGTETVEVRLRCSDAPILNSPFGKESKRYLESLLHGSGPVNFKIQAYCGSESCVEVFAYIPEPTQASIDYINTKMIAAGMARNDSCRGVFKEAEVAAKSAKKGIWSTTKRIVFAEAVKVAAPTEAKASVKSSAAAAQKLTPPKAFVEVDRVERTVTLKSREMSLNRAISTIDSVSTLPVSLYLYEDQYFPLAMEKVPWYAALQQIVKLANLKQVNMNGKIDLYDQFFYYKHIAPYMKLSDNDGAYIKVGSGSRDASVSDDGVTRYVFNNDYENSAANARAREESQSGYVQVHKNEGQAPVSNDGRFEISNTKKEPVAVKVVEPEIVRPILKPYDGKPVAIEKAPVIVADAAAAVPKAEKPVNAVTTAPEPVEAVDAERGAVKESATIPAVKPDVKSRKTVPPSKNEPAAAVGVVKGAEPLSEQSVEIDTVQLAILLIVVIVVIFGSLYLSRSAARRAARAERTVDAASLGQQKNSADVETAPLIDEEYEQKVFEDIDHVASTTGSEVVADAASGKDVATPIEQKIEVEPPSVPEAEVAVQSDPEVTPAVAKKKPVKKAVKGAVVDEGNYAVTLEDYDRMMNPPKREPRVDCLFEVKCSLEGKSLTGIGLDISSGGIFIDSKEKFAVGKVLELEFRLEEDDSVPIYCRGAVTWINERPDPIKPNYPNGFGVCFLELEDAIEVAISDFLHPTGLGSVDDSEDES